MEKIQNSICKAFIFVYCGHAFLAQSLFFDICVFFANSLLFVQKKYWLGNF